MGLFPTVPPYDKYGYQDANSMLKNGFDKSDSLASDETRVQLDDKELIFVKKNSVSGYIEEIGKKNIDQHFYYLWG